MTNNLFNNQNVSVFFYKFLKKNIVLYKYIYLKKKQCLNNFLLLHSYSYNNFFFFNLIPVILIFRIITPIFFKLIYQYKNFLIVENDPKLKFFLKIICKNLRVNCCFNWIKGSLTNWTYFRKSNSVNFSEENKLFYFPELIITPNSDKNIMMLNESFYMNIYTVSIVSNLQLFKLVSYPILGNCNNVQYNKLILFLLYFVIIYSYSSRMKYRNYFSKKKMQ